MDIEKHWSIGGFYTVFVGLSTVAAIFSACFTRFTQYSVVKSSTTKADKHARNSRNGYNRKTIISDYGTSEVAVPRDRNGEFEPQVLAKRQVRTDEIEQKIIAMYSKGMSQRDIEDTLREIYGAEDLVTDFTWLTREERLFINFGGNRGEEYVEFNLTDTYLTIRNAWDVLMLTRK